MADYTITLTTNQDNALKEIAEKANLTPQDYISNMVKSYINNNFISYIVNNNTITKDEILEQNAKLVMSKSVYLEDLATAKAEALPVK